MLIARFLFCLLVCVFVEDSPSVRRILKTVAAQLANKILECVDGDESLTIYRAEKPDFVLADLY